MVTSSGVQNVSSSNTQMTVFLLRHSSRPEFFTGMLPMAPVTVASSSRMRLHRSSGMTSARTAPFSFISPSRTS